MCSMLKSRCSVSFLTFFRLIHFCRYDVVYCLCRYDSLAVSTEHVGMHRLKRLCSRGAQEDFGTVLCFVVSNGLSAQQSSSAVESVMSLY